MAPTEACTGDNPAVWTRTSTRPSSAAADASAATDDRVRHVRHLLDHEVAFDPQTLSRFPERGRFHVGQQQRRPGAEPSGDGQSHPTGTGHDDDAITLTHATPSLSWFCAGPP